MPMSRGSRVICPTSYDNRKRRAFEKNQKASVVTMTAEEKNPRRGNDGANTTTSFVVREEDETSEDGNAWDERPQHGQEDVVPLMGDISGPSNLRRTHDDDDDESYRRRLAARRRSRILPLELARWRIMSEDSFNRPTTCLGDAWRMGASLMLASLVALLLAFGGHGRAQQNLHVDEVWPSDALDCARNYNISFSETFERIIQSSSSKGDICSATTTTTTTNHASCNCFNPLVPFQYKLESKAYRDEWDLAFARNVEMSLNAASSERGDDRLDVVILGDSITEHFIQADLFQTKEKWRGVKEEFDRFFDKKHGADLQGLPLGIAGDQCSQLRYRMEHGEIPNGLNPKVWWIEIGTNDLADWCSAESVLMGIIGISRELQKVRPGVPVVINSILPRGGGRKGKTRGNLWESIVWINDRLECYVEGVEHVEYFDATSLFTTGSDKAGVDLALLGDGLHPSANGTRVWGEAIVQKVKGLILKYVN